MAQETDHDIRLDDIIARSNGSRSEIPVNIYDLGRYTPSTPSATEIVIDMTLTAGVRWPHIARAGRTGRRERGWRSSCKVTPVWDPPWTKERMSDEAKLELGML